MAKTETRGAKPKDPAVVQRMRAVNINDAIWLPFCKLAKSLNRGRSDLLRQVIREFMERERNE